MSTSQSQKRNMEEEGAARPARKRARKACVECHNRKIRCDLYLRGAPCTNCEEDGQNCVLHVRKGKRSKAEADSNGQTHQRTSPNYGSGPEQVHQEVPPPSNGPNAMGMPSGANSNPPDIPAMSSYHMFGSVPNHFPNADMHNLPMTDMQTMDTSATALPPDAIPLMDSDFSHFIDLDTIFGPTNGLPSPYPDPFSYGGNDLMSDNVDSPLIRIGASPSNSSQQSQLLDTMDWTIGDKAFLKSQGCFALPHSGALYRLMRVYFTNVHPNLPMVNEADFWTLWPSQSVKDFQLGSFSLFVLQSMCFAACSFAPVECVQECGFTNAAVARENFHRRAKLLFDFNFEKNPLHLSQGALLLSYHVRNMDRLRKNSQWLTNAILYAHVAFGDRSSLQIADHQKRERALKRLWWCAVLRDRILPLGLRRPIQIMVIDLQPLTEADFQDELGKSKVHDTPTQTSIFQVICTTCQLAAALTPALHQMYSSGKPQERVPSSPDDLMNALKEVRKNITRLQEWQEVAKEKFPSPIGLGDTNTIVTVFANLMFIYCNAAIIGLCHHGMLIWESRASASATPLETPYDHKYTIEQAMEGTTERVRELVQMGLIDKTPLSLTAYLTFPLLLNAITARSAAGTPLEGAAGRQLEIYSRAMRFQRSIYDAADFAFGVVERIMTYAEDCRVMSGQSSPTHDPTDESSNHAVSKAPGGKIPGVFTWKDLLRTKPRLYLRLAVHLDLAFCGGIPPEEDDFPPQLRLRSHS